jgi:protein-S-isoprenylcysteine O-methyltransferase Ste14
MIICIGNFLFRYRNGLFPVVYLLIFFQGRAVFSDYRMAALTGLLVASAGQALRAVTVGLEYIIRGGRKWQVYAEQLVQGGVYAYCRNPLYVGNALIILGLGLAANSWLFLSVAVPFFVIAYWTIIAAEENYLRGKFGQEFDDYCQRVRRILPTMRKSAG